MKQLAIFLMALSLFGVLGCRSVSEADLATRFKLHNIYTDHMVLQRDVPIQITGTAEANRTVKVSLGDDSTYATADASGHWCAVLPALKAGGPYMLAVSGSAKSPALERQDILIGDIWICSGQSNMEMPVWGPYPAWRSINGDKAVATSANSKLRLFNTPRVSSIGAPEEEISNTVWEVASPESVIDFSALGYYFGRQLQKELDIPIGLINSCWQGTPIQPWISQEALRDSHRTPEVSRIDDYLKKHATTPDWKQRMAQTVLSKQQKWDKSFKDFNTTATAAARTWKNADFNDSSWKTVKLPLTFAKDKDGVMWCRYSVTLPADWAGQNLILALGVVNDCDETYFNGTKVGATTTQDNAYAAIERRYPVPADLVKPGKNVIAVRLSDLQDEGGLLSTSPCLYQQEDRNQKINLDSPWKVCVEYVVDSKALGKRPVATEPFPGSQNFPSALYNSMIAPWIHFPIKGAIWYQGEANAGQPHDYMVLHPLLIQDWRNRWKNPTMPFIFVQLAAFEQHTPSTPLPSDFWKNRAPADHPWADLREVQTATLAVPNTGMAVSIDIGDSSDIHPKDKLTLAHRMVAEAGRITYGRKTVSAGPIYREMKVEGNRIRLYFDNVGSGLMAKGGTPASFAIAGKDGKFVWAKAEIDGDTILVHADAIAHPAAVRYAWASYPGNPNLYNKEGFPASPFRTDQPGYLLKKQK